MDKKVRDAINEVVNVFWVVTRPSRSSTLQDIIFECDLEGLSNNFAGGLKPDDIIGVWTTEDSAMVVAEELFERTSRAYELELAIESAMKGGGG